MKKYILKWVRNGIRSLKEIVYKYLGILFHRFSATAVAGIPGPNQTLPIDDALVCASITRFVSKTQSHGSTGGGVGRMGTSSKQEKVLCTQVALDNKTLYNSSGKRDRAEISGRAGT